MSNPRHPNAWSNLRQALQYLLDCEDAEGWQLNHFVACLGIQRIDSTGEITSTAWLAIPAEQAGYITDGLLSTAEEMLACAGLDDD